MNLMKQILTGSLTALLALAAAAGDELAAPFRADCAKQAETGEEMTIKGNDGWLFLRNELRHLGVGKFWGEAAAKVSRAAVPEQADPLEAILDYHEECKKQGVELILLPIPPKAVIYPEMISSTVKAEDGKVPRLDTFHQEFYKLLRDKGVNVIDLTDALLAQRLAAAGAMYCRTDTHYSGKACELAAAVLAKEIKARPWYANAKKVKITTETREVEISGDLREALNDDSVPKETLTLRQVNLDGKPIEPDRDSPVLVMGDSHCLVFHAGGDMFATAAGLADQLAAELQMTIDDLGVRGSGAHPARVNLYRRIKGSAGYLEKKKVIIWCFTAREFTEANRWGKVPLKK